MAIPNSDTFYFSPHFFLMEPFVCRKQEEITVAAGRLQGQYDAMATTSVSNSISSLLLHLSLLNPEAGNFLLLHFIYYAIIVGLISPLCPSTPHSLRQSPHHRSCPWLTHVSSLASPFPVLYFASPRLLYLYFPIPSPLHPFPPVPLPSGSHHSALCVRDSVSPCSLNLFFRFSC